MTYADKLLLWFIYFVVCLSIPYSANSLESAYVGKISSVKMGYHARLVQLDQNIAGTLSALQSNLQRIKNLDETEMRVNALLAQKKEYKARLAFYDKLIFLSDGIISANERDFYLRALNKIVNTLAPSTETHEVYWKLSIYLKSAIATSTQESDDITLFVEEFLKSSSVLNPTDPGDFLKLRDYTNGLENLQAHTIDPIEAGDKAEAIEEKRLSSLKAQESNTLPFEQRSPVFKPVQSIMEPRTLLKAPIETITKEMKKASLAVGDKTSSPKTSLDFQEEKVRVRLLPKNQK